MPVLVVPLLPITAGGADLQRTFEGRVLVELEGTPEAFTAAARALRAAPGNLADAPGVEPLFETDAPVALRGLTARPGTRRRWVVVTPAPSTAARELGATRMANPWDVSHDIADGRARPAYQNLLRSLPRAPGVRVTAVEPDVTYFDPRMDQVMRARTKALQAARCQPPTLHW